MKAKGGVDKKTRWAKRLTHPADLKAWSVRRRVRDADDPVVDLTDHFVSDQPNVPMPQIPPEQVKQLVMTMLEGKAGVPHYFFNDVQELVTHDHADFLPFKHSKLLEEGGNKFLRTDFLELAKEPEDRLFIFTWRICAPLDPTNSGKSRRCFWYGLQNLQTGRNFTLMKGPKHGMVKELLQLHTM